MPQPIPTPRLLFLSYFSFSSRSWFSPLRGKRATCHCGLLCVFLFFSYYQPSLFILGLSPQKCIYILYHLESFRGHKKSQPKAKIYPKDPSMGLARLTCTTLCKIIPRMMGFLSSPFLLCFDGFGMASVRRLYYPNAQKVRDIFSLALLEGTLIVSVLCIPSSFSSAGKMHLI